MKRPYFNTEQRKSIRLQTIEGAFLELSLASKKIIRETRKEYGWIASIKVKREIVKIVNARLFGR